MKKADLILKNAIILSMDSSMSIFNPGALAIEADHILDVGPESDILSEFQAEQTVDCLGKVLMPGLINAHTHVPMTLLRGLADDLRLDVWLMGYMMPVEREFVSPDFVRLGTLLACAEMIRSGVTTFVDMYYFEEDVARAAADAGMRAICSQTVLKFPSPDASPYEESLAAARDFIKRWKGHPLIVPSVAPHAPYTCTDEILNATAKLAIEFDVPLHTHLSETALEVENMRKQTGMPVIPYVKKQGLLDAKVIAAHCVHIDEGEIRTLIHSNTGVSHNPSSNMKLASGIAPVSKMLNLGLKVGIGTDGPASNNDLDMFEEVRLASFLAKTGTGDPTALPATTALLMATRMGAEAIHLDDITGSLTPGKRADLILVDISPLHNQPHFRRSNDAIYAQLVYASKSSDVTDVMINGKWVLKQGALMTINLPEILQQSQDLAHKIDAFLTLREQSILSKLIAIGGAIEEETFEVQVKIPIKDTQPVINALSSPEIEIIRNRHYREYDTYFSFEDNNQGYIRYREDHFIDNQNNVSNVRSRLTHIGPAREGHIFSNVLLSRSRYIAPAIQSLRFYREYFKPRFENEIEKDRLRFLIKYQGTEFFINIDTLIKPGLGSFLEIKSRTWSKKDAEQKSQLATQLAELIGISVETATPKDYFEML
ncbi:MAG: amidohydrolase family protein [Anaerolineae bacterium]|nr:amidohydrolase family protein [Anaerolineae bacterium]